MSESRPRVDHVGIAVRSLETALPLYAAMTGDEASGPEEVASEGVRVAFFGTGPGRVELLEPTREDSPIARYLERHGPGLHHLCLRVDDVEEAVRRARRDGAELVEPGIRTGAGGARVAFVHPRSTGGVLIELSEGGSP